MVKCSKCGYNNKEGHEFCEECGHKLISIPLLQNKKIVYTSLVIGLILISMVLGLIMNSPFEKNTTQNGTKGTEELKSEVVCNKPYLRFGTSCCLDQNDDNICDNDQNFGGNDASSNASCSDECASDECSGSEYISCLDQKDGCKDRMNKGKVTGKCGVDCIFNSNCQSNEQCLNNKCVTPSPTCADECSSDECSGLNYLACLKQSDSCNDLINKGKVKGKCGVECKSNSDCSSNEECKNNHCEEKTCSPGEIGVFCEDIDLYSWYQNQDCSITKTLIDSCATECSCEEETA